MSKVGDDLFVAYRKYKGMDVDSPQYEPLENSVVSKEELKKLKAREYNKKYNESHKWELRCKRKDKVIEELRKQIEELQVARREIWEYAWYNVTVLWDEERANLMSHIEWLKEELEKEKERREDMRQIVRILSKYI